MTYFILINTQAVSYEDIKSAEATIKGGISTPNTSNTVLNKIDEKVIGGISNYASDQPPSTPPPPIPSTLPNALNSHSVNSSASPILSHGVSSLSTLFGEPLKQPNSYYHTPATFLSNNSITPLAHSPASSAQVNLIDSQRSMMSKTQIELPTSHATNSNVNNNNNSNNNHYSYHNHNLNNRMRCKLK